MSFFRFGCLAATLMLSACSNHGADEGGLASSEKTAGTHPSPAASNTEAKPKPVVGIKPESRPYIVVETIQPKPAAGVVKAPARIDFRARGLSTVGTVVAGRVVKLSVQVGDRVKVGAPLATLASSEAAQMRSDLLRTRSELQRAEDRARRQQEMQKAGVGLDVERVEADAQLDEARADYARSAQVVNLLGQGAGDEVTLRAPKEGAVLRTSAAVGSAVEPGTVLFELGEPDAIWAIADVFENDLRLIEKGAEVELEIASLTTPIKGHVEVVSASIQPDLRRAAVFIDLDNPGFILKAGMFARASIQAAGPDRIVLPTTAVLIKDGKRSIVYVENPDGSFQSRDVLVGQVHEGNVPILEGLQTGDRVVVSGALLLDGEAATLL